jgi:glutathione synthase/RimK-type ligase-like ATP-grasp enzyme
MNSNIKALITACDRNQIHYEVLHENGNLIAVNTGRSLSLFTNRTTPVNPHSVSKLCDDKDFAYVALSSHMRMAQTLSFLDPHSEAKYSQYLKFQTHQEIVNEIEEKIGYPVILKRNRGSHGSNVFSINEKEDLLAKLIIIFDKRSKDYDYILLAQEAIKIKKEYRAIFYNEKLVFAYLKDNQDATYTGNLSPLHWDGAKAVKVRDPELLKRFQAFVSPGLMAIGLKYTGIDLAEDHNGKLWAIEVNAAPSFDIYIRDCGMDDVVNLFTLMLIDLGAIS